LFTGSEEEAGRKPAGAHRPAKPESERPNVVVRGTNRKVIELENGVRWERLTAASHHDVDFLAVEYAPGGASASTMMRHAGKEYGIVLSGTLTVTVNFDDYLLGPGDSIAFPSTTPHRLWNAGEEPVHGIWVVTGRHRSTPADSI